MYKTYISSSTQCTKYKGGGHGQFLSWATPTIAFNFFSFVLITEKPPRRSGVAVVVDPSRHPRLRLGNVRLDFPVFVLGSFLFDPHSVVARDAVLLTRALEESALRGGRRTAS